MLTYNPPWWERGTNPDLVTRGLGVGSGPVTLTPDQVDANAQGLPPGLVSPWLTVPSQRPVVYQRGLNFSFSAGTAAAQVQNFRYEVDSFVVNVPSTAANSVFVGYSGVSLTNGVEVRPGIPIEFATDNTREQWELQRALEQIAATLAHAYGGGIQAPYRAPRVVFNLADIWIIASATTAISIMTFNVPEQQ